MTITVFTVLGGALVGAFLGASPLYFHIVLGLIPGLFGPDASPRFAPTPLALIELLFIPLISLIPAYPTGLIGGAVLSVAAVVAAPLAVLRTAPVSARTLIFGTAVISGIFTVVAGFVVFPDLPWACLAALPTMAFGAFIQKAAIQTQLDY